MKRYSNGSAIAQYGIIIALVGIALIPLFFLIGKNIVVNFQKMEEGLNGQKLQDSSLSVSNSSVKNTNLPGIAAGSLGGTENKPVLKCDNATCTIDYGTFVLSGIPEDFNEFLESAGASGGTNALLSLIEQIAAQLEQNGDVAEAIEFRELANLGHFIAKVESNIEDIATSCESSNQTAAQSCFISNTNKLNIDIPENIKHLVPELTSEIEYSLIDDMLRIDGAQNRRYEDITGFENDKDYYPSLAYIDKLNSILNSTKISELHKEVAVELSKTISDLSFHQANLYSKLRVVDLNVTDDKSWFGLYKYDIITGESLGSRTVSTKKGINAILNPKTSIGTDLNSVLICVNGSYKDSGKACK